MFHIIHSPRFALLAPLKPKFGIGTRDQRFGYSSPTMSIDPVELLRNSLGRNRSRGAYLILHWVGSFMFFGYNPGEYLDIPFRQLPLASTVTPVGCGSSFVVACRHYPGYHGSWCTTKSCCPGHRCTSETRTNNSSPFELWYVSHCVDCNVLCTAVLLLC